MVTIENSNWQDGTWTVFASVVIDKNTYYSSYQIEGPENMTEAKIKKAILALYS